MSMTREEAAHILEYSRIVSENFTQEAVTATYVMALAALRGPTREQVERVWRGEWQVCFEEWQNHRVEGEQCSKCGFQNYGPSNLYNFCPKCGSPMTDKAVEMVMERLEEMKGD